MATIYVDFGSPYAYLAWQRIRAEPENFPGLTWKPVSAGHIFKMDGSRPNSTLPNQGNYLLEDVRRLAATAGVPFHPPTGDGAMPVNSIPAMRIYYGAQSEGKGAQWMEACFLAYFRDGMNLYDAEVLRGLQNVVGIDVDPDQWKTPLIEATQEAYDAGAPGVPFIVLGNGADAEHFWGQDRLDFVAARLA